MKEQIINSLIQLEKYIRDHNYCGYDPYDALNSEKLSEIDSKWMKILFTQFLVYSPLNLRRFFNIQEGVNPKAVGLFLRAYCKLYKNGLIDNKLFESVSSKLIELLLKYRSEGYSGYCWGFNFNWQDISRNARKWLPTIVVTSNVGNSFLDLYEITDEEKYRNIAKSICRFILEDLYITKNKEGICFSYTPIDKEVVHNANCLGASFLSRVYSITQEVKLLDYSQRAFDFTISHQKKDGSWAYSLNPLTNQVRNQIDFHQGFIIDALCDFISFNQSNDEIYLNSLKKAVSFYKEYQFYDNGCSMWRLPYRYPIDIHHQAQGIITFCKLYSTFKDKIYLNFSKEIARWTIENMQDKKGYFYYQKWPFFINKISYMRWGQAWMMLALTMLLYNINQNR